VNGLIIILLVSQPQGALLWNRADTGGVYNSVTAGDIDLDGIPDVVATFYYGYVPDPPWNLVCHSGADGHEIWISRDCQGTWGTKALAACPDATGDSIPDIILGTPGGVAPGSSVFLKNGRDGSTHWTWCTYTQGPNWGWVYAVRPFADLNHDGFPEIIAAAGGNSNDRSGTAFCFNGHTGDTVWTFRVPADGGQCISAIPDITGDSVPEVAVGAGGNGLDNHVYCLNGATGARIWDYDLGGSVWSVNSIPDLTGDGIDDIVAGGWNYNVAAINAVNGARIWDVSLGSGRIVMEVVPIQDVNGDSLDDVVVGSWSNMVTVLSGRDGSVAWSEPVGGDCWNVDTLPDVTGDGIPEVVVGALNGKKAEVFDGVGHQPLWASTFQERIYDVSTVADLNQDGKPEVIVGLQDQGNQTEHIFAYKGQGPDMVAEQRRVEPGWHICQTGAGLEVAGPAVERCRVLLVSLNGRVERTLYSGTLSTGRLRLPLNVSGLPAGCAFAVLMTPGCRFATKVIIAH
jgi:outer membrane protein assembly factor BamB